MWFAPCILAAFLFRFRFLCVTIPGFLFVGAGDATKIQSITLSAVSLPPWILTVVDRRGKHVEIVVISLISTSVFCPPSPHHHIFKGTMRSQL